MWARDRQFSNSVESQSSFIFDIIQFLFFLLFENIDTVSDNRTI